MSDVTLLYAVLIFGAVAALTYAVFLQFSPTRTQKRIAEVTGASPYGTAPAGDEWMVTIAKLTGPFAKLSLPKGGWGTSPLRQRFLHAGVRGDGPIALYFGAKTILALALPMLAYVYLEISARNFSPPALLFILLCLATLGYYLPNYVLHRMVLHRQRTIFENFPDATDLMLVCVEAGLGLDAALAKVADEMRHKCVPLAQELHLVNLEIQAGGSRESALRNLALRTGVDSLDTFATMLIQADRFGTSIGDSLRVLSEELRTKRQLAAEETAAKIPLKLLFPLVFFIFPSMLLVLLGPAVIQIDRILLPILHGH
ncbi:MAG: type II secretion system F family protein [Betaproteobacteria bacterium]|jgi:tight adherence protein C|nr:type II secretion system F family protein [Betaproteobacteria bacterium]